MIRNAPRPSSLHDQGHQAEAVLAGLGVSPLPCVFGDREPRLLRLAPGVFGHHEMWLVVHPDLHESARVRAVLDFLTMLIRDEAPLWSGRLGPAGQRVRARRRA